MRKIIVYILLIAILFQSNTILLSAEKIDDWNEYKVNINYSREDLQKNLINNEIRIKHYGNSKNDKYDISLLINENEDSLLIINIIKKSAEERNPLLLDLEDLKNNLILLSLSCCLGMNVAAGISDLMTINVDEYNTINYLTMVIASIVAPLLLTIIPLKLNCINPLYILEIENEKKLCFNIVINKVNPNQYIYESKKQITVDLKNYSSYLNNGCNQIELTDIKNKIKIMIEMELK